MLVRGVCALIVAACCSLAARAEIEKNVRLESEPAGAKVYLLRSSQRIPLGTTPIDYRAEFHSEHSILRFAFELPAHAPQTLEVNASQGSVVAKLAARTLVADPLSLQDMGLRGIQQRINPSLASTLTAMLAQRSGEGIDLSGLARVRRLDDSPYLVLPLLLSSPATSLESRRDLLTAILSEVEAKMPNGSGLAGIVADAQIGAPPRPGGGAAVQQTVVMECVGGYEYEYLPCMQRAIPTGYCVPGTLTKYNPCLNRVPTTQRTVTVDTTAKATGSQRLYIVSRIGAGRSELGILHLDQDGRVLVRQGNLPERWIAELPSK
jgi:hypothetical protein